MYTLTVTLTTGQTCIFTRGHLPRHWQSWVMRQLPYATNWQGSEFAVSFEPAPASRVTVREEN